MKLNGVVIAAFEMEEIKPSKEEQLLRAIFGDTEEYYDSFYKWLFTQQ